MKNSIFTQDTINKMKEGKGKKFFQKAFNSKLKKLNTYYIGDGGTRFPKYEGPKRKEPSKAKILKAMKFNYNR